MTTNAEKCRMALRAALGAMQDNCGDPVKAPHPINILGASAEISDQIRHIAENQELTVEERITTIKKSVEIRELAERLCSPNAESFSRMKPGETEEECIDNVATLAAEILVSETESKYKIQNVIP